MVGQIFTVDEFVKQPFPKPDGSDLGHLTFEYEGPGLKGTLVFVPISEALNYVGAVVRERSHVDEETKAHTFYTVAPKGSMTWDEVQDTIAQSRYQMYVFGVGVLKPDVAAKIWGAVLTPDEVNAAN